MPLLGVNESAANQRKYRFEYGCSPVSLAFRS